ncbi:hypothetical protein [Brucella sp. IR073]|uniref:hypothetical protein n=1 Tax=unclassified Brucella TaxID=2632610 RepID=UPI003B9860EF
MSADDDPLGLSALTDDQLVEMARHVAVELGKRHYDVMAAAQAAILSEHDKAKLALEAAEKEAARLRKEEAERVAREAADKVRAEMAKASIAKTQKNWAKKKILAMMVSETLGPGWYITVWNRDGDDKRVYIDGPGKGQNERGYTKDAKITYYVTGNSSTAPGKLVILQLPNADEKLIRVICEQASRDWNRLQQVNCDDAIQSPVSPAPYPQSYLDAKEAKNV